MIKKVLGILTVATIMFACGNKEQKKETAGEKEITKVTVDQIMTDLQSFVDKSVAITGTVNHVCSHGGKRMFIIGENPDLAIKITPGEKIGVFEKELEGSTVLVTGIVKELRIDEAYVAGLEEELESGTDNEAVHDHSGGTHEEKGEHENENPQIKMMKEKIAESEDGYYSQYWIDASKLEEKECEHEKTEKDTSDCDNKKHDNEGENHDEDKDEKHDEEEEEKHDDDKVKKNDDDHEHSDAKDYAA